MEKEIEEVDSDLSEIESLLNTAKRQRIKNFLSIELRKLIAKRQKMEETFKEEKTTKPIKNSQPREKRFQVKIDNYAWDQSPKYIKFFLTLPKVHQLDPENIKCQFATDNLTMTVKNLENKNYNFNVTKLLHPVVPEKSFWRVDSDSVVIFLVKTSALKWPYLTKNDEEKALQKKNKLNPKKVDRTKENSLFSVMKDMYQNGNDTIKRTIAQAWSESRSDR